MSNRFLERGGKMKNIVNVSEELCMCKNLLSDIINRDYDKMALVLLGEDMELRSYRDELSIIRLYLFMKEGGEHVYEKELGNFSFHSQAPALESLEILQKMTA